MNVSRTHRLLQLIGLLQTATGYNAPSLAQFCGVTRRTIFRDLDMLRKSGLPLEFDPVDRRYRFPKPAYLPPLNFTAEEALAMMVVCHELGDRAGLPFLDPAHSAAIKLESHLPPRLREHLRNVAPSVEIHPPPSNPLDGQAGVYQQLLVGLAEKRCLRIHYHSLAERQDITTRLSPFRLLFSRRSWYVIGRSSLHRGTRTFNLSRILQIELLDDKYKIPRDFSTERYLRNAWHLIPEGRRDQEVLIRFSPMVAENVAEVLWHKTQRATFNDDGTLDYRATVSGLQEISWWILGYGDQAEAIEPPELRQMVATRAAKAAALYADQAVEAAVPTPHTFPHPTPIPRPNS
jgi:proteasome accessory factor B